jgi:serine/threonine protein kinase
MIIQQQNWYKTAIGVSLALHLTEAVPFTPGRRHLVAKVGDVGLAKWAALRDGAAASMVQGCSSAVAGTWGHTDQQFMQFGSYGPGSDVYSLGAVMLQLLTARPMVDFSNSSGPSE